MTPHAAPSPGLERAKTLWLAADWPALAAIDAEAMSCDPQRATLAAFVAVAHRQLGDVASSRRAQQLTVEWGCPPELAARIFLAGAHRSLARAHAARGRLDRAREHLRAAFGPPDVGSASPRITSVTELHDDLEALAGQHQPPRLEAGRSSAGIPADIAAGFMHDCSLDDLETDWELAERSELRVGGRQVSVRSYSIGETRFSIALRPASKGDQGTSDQILVNKDYDFEWLPQGKSMRALYNQLVALGRKPLIIDAGANIGVSPLYFLHRYPAARVFAIEPDLDNAQLLKLNCRGRDVTLFAGALAAGAGELFFVDPGQGDWGFRAEEQGDRSLPTLGVPEILSAYPSVAYPPLIVKVDIEGGEKRIFEAGASWLDHVPLLIIELHDWMLPGEETSAGFRMAVAQRRFEIIPRGENLLCFNRQLLMF